MRASAQLDSGPLPTPCPQGTTYGPPTYVLYGRPGLATQSLCCIRFPDFIRFMEWWAQNVDLGSANGIFFWGGISPLKFLGARMNTPYDIINLRTYRVLRHSFAKIGPGTSKNL